jgi:hypothetical protein
MAAAAALLVSENLHLLAVLALCNVSLRALSFAEGSDTSCFTYFTQQPKKTNYQQPVF